MSIETTTLNTENLIGGAIVTTNITVAAGTYFEGQALGRLTATDVYGNLNTGVSTGLEFFKAVAVADITLVAEGRMQVYTTGSELMKRGIVDGSGDQLTITNALTENARDNGIILKN